MNDSFGSTKIRSQVLMATILILHFPSCSIMFHKFPIIFLSFSYHLPHSRSFPSVFMVIACCAKRCFGSSSHGAWLCSRIKPPTTELQGAAISSFFTGWWYTYPSEKYESQLGVLFPMYGKIQVMFQTTNQFTIDNLRN